MISAIICYLIGHKWPPSPNSYYMIDREHALIAATHQCLRCERTRTTLSTLATLELR